MKRRTKRRLLQAGMLVAVLGVLGLLVAASGLVPITASSGHWAITSWLLHFAMRRSVATHSIGLALPPLDQPWQVLQGAGHYETGCRPCHGSPGRPLPRVPAAMTPAPPALAPRIAEWNPEELFYIVKHGVKFTGMPAWPTQQRDDEVEAMVAFLLTLPDLDAEGYRRLVLGNADDAVEVAPVGGLAGVPDPPPAVETCARCHGRDGNGRGAGAFPKLAGQREQYLLNALDAYARGVRHSGIMQPVAASLREAEMRELAAYYAGLPRSAGHDGDAAAIERGGRIAREGIFEQRVAACAGCHGPGPTERNEAYPRLAGQYARYLVSNLELFEAGRRGGSRWAHLMHEVAPRLRREQMRDVAAYYASLPPAAPNGD